MPATLESPLASGFAELGLSKSLLTAVQKLGFDTPTPIQREAIPIALRGQDLVGIAQTGTGKTLAFGLPMMARLLEIGGMGLVLVPTRELALQVEADLQRVGRTMGLRTVVLIGGAPMGRQIAQLRDDPHVVVATPGRLMDHLMQRNLKLSEVSVAVLDEADRMLDMGFAPSIRQILGQTPTDRQTMLFSATMPPEIANLAQGYMRKPERVEIERAGTAAGLVTQELCVVPKEGKNALLEDLLLKNPGTVLVFARTRHGARKVAKTVRLMGHTAAELHSDRTLPQRKAALEGFKSGAYRVLVATDIASRGIDVKEISLVVNYDLPDQAEDYVHRIGRTGRAGAPGRAITIATPDQSADVRAIERLIRQELPLSGHSSMTLERPVAQQSQARPSHRPQNGHPARRRR